MRKTLFVAFATALLALSTSIGQAQERQSSSIPNNLRTSIRFEPMTMPIKLDGTSSGTHRVSHEIPGLLDFAWILGGSVVVASAFIGVGLFGLGRSLGTARSSST